MSESLGLTSHKSSCNCTGCGMLRGGVCINCAEKIAALILESSTENSPPSRARVPAARRSSCTSPRRQSAAARRERRERRSCRRYRSCCNIPPRHWRGRWCALIALRASDFGPSRSARAPSRAATPMEKPLPNRHLPVGRASPYGKTVAGQALAGGRRLPLRKNRCRTGTCRVG